MTKMPYAIGLMSGTSLDGVDAALIRTDGETVERTPYFVHVPYSDEFVATLSWLVANRMYVKRQETQVIEIELTNLHVRAVKTLIEKAGLETKDIHVVGFHGQTIDHRPEDGETWQMGDGPMLANKTGVDVVYDFRRGDVEAGGQGAPLIPLYHFALAKSLPRPVAFLNLGGIGNVTYMGQGEEIIAFDTGPGNALLNDWMQKHFQLPMDKNGEVGARGAIDAEILNQLLEQPYFSKEPPKSLDREELKLEEIYGHLTRDVGAATLTAFTAHAVARSVALLPRPPKKWYVTGGGMHNTTMMNMMALLLQGAELQPVTTLGLNPDAMEAEGFAYLAVRTLKGMPISLPKTTGIRHSVVTGGVFCSHAEGCDS